MTRWIQSKRPMQGKASLLLWFNELFSPSRCFVPPFYFNTMFAYSDFSCAYTTCVYMADRLNIEIANLWETRHHPTVVVVNGLLHCAGLCRGDPKRKARLFEAKAKEFLGPVSYLTKVSTRTTERKKLWSIAWKCLGEILRHSSA